jgi:hypothetical protein
MDVEYIIRGVTATELHLKSMNKEDDLCPKNSQKHLLLPEDIHDTSFRGYAVIPFCSLTH